jgi:hypothetical protein
MKIGMVEFTDKTMPGYKFSITCSKTVLRFRGYSPEGVLVFNAAHRRKRAKKVTE